LKPVAEPAITNGTKGAFMDEILERVIERRKRLYEIMPINRYEWEAKRLKYTPEEVNVWLDLVYEARAFCKFTASSYQAITKRHGWTSRKAADFLKRLLEDETLYISENEIKKNQPTTYIVASSSQNWLLLQEMGVAAGCYYYMQEEEREEEEAKRIAEEYVRLMLKPATVIPFPRPYVGPKPD
jgi:hypothetical protein